MKRKISWNPARLLFPVKFLIELVLAFIFIVIPWIILFISHALWSLGRIVRRRDVLCLKKSPLFDLTVFCSDLFIVAIILVPF